MPPKDNQEHILYFVRHCQTDWSLEKRIQGHASIPLNTHGRQEAKQLKLTLDSIDFTYCFSSDLARAYETAQILTKDRHIKITADPRLRERNYGKWQGMPNQSLPENPTGIETDQEMHQRISDFLKEMAYTPGKILVVTHWGVIREVMSQILHKSLKDSDLNLQPDFILKIKYDDIWHIQ